MMHGGLLTEDAKLRERAVGDRELARLLAGEDVAQRSVALSSLLVVHHRVPVAEGAALAVLPAQPHMVPCTGKRTHDTDGHRAHPLPSTTHSSHRVICSMLRTSQGQKTTPGINQHGEIVRHTQLPFENSAPII